jgi:hypothetical protein
MNTIYNNYLIFNNCTNLFEITNKHSRIDYILQSGETQIAIEFKQRNYSTFDFTERTALIEFSKFKALKQSSKLLDAPAFYIQQWFDAVLIFDLTNMGEDSIHWIEEQHNKNNDEGAASINKAVGYLPYTGASYIISTHDWLRKSKQALTNYLNEKQPIYE